MKTKYKPKEKFMQEAISIAKRDFKKHEEQRIGAVIVKNNKIIAKSANRILRDVDPSSHAEIAAMRLACKRLKSLDMSGCILYTTNEPCCMCTGAVVWGKMKGIVCGANVKDLEKKMKKQGKNFEFFITCEEILKRQKPRITFLIKNFMRKQCVEFTKLKN
ncbi:nucleoside deaminase [Patescibacteria group bacterium]